MSGHESDSWATPPSTHAAALILTVVDGIESMAARLASQLGLTIEIASTRAVALRLLERRTYSIVVVDQFFSDSDPDTADLIWKSAGHAIPLQVSFALAGMSRIEREMRAALLRRQREQSLAAVAAAASVDAEIRNAVTAFLLESRLALAEENSPAPLRSRLESMAEIADRLHQLLSAPASRDATPVGLSRGSG